MNFRKYQRQFIATLTPWPETLIPWLGVVFAIRPRLYYLSFWLHRTTRDVDCFPMDSGGQGVADAGPKQEVLDWLSQEVLRWQVLHVLRPIEPVESWEAELEFYRSGTVRLKLGEYTPWMKLKWRQESTT